MHLVWITICFTLITPTPIHTQNDERDGELSRKILGSSVVTSVSVVMETGNGKHTYYSDAVGHPLNKPHIASQVASPINLLNPDRYEFYTFNDNGELVKRLMTIDEIQGIIAGGDVDNLNYNNEYNQMMNPDNDVSDIVENVQNVLKEEIESHKYTQDSIPLLDTPDVSSTWDTILPLVFGDNMAVHDDTIPEIIVENINKKNPLNSTTEKPKSTTKLSLTSNLERTTEDIYIQTTNKNVLPDNISSNNIPNLAVSLEENEKNNIQNIPALILPDTAVNQILENILFSSTEQLDENIEKSTEPVRTTIVNEKITLPLITERINVNDSMVETMATKLDLPKITELVSIITRPVTQVTEKITSMHSVHSTNSVQVTPMLVLNTTTIPPKFNDQNIITDVNLKTFEKINITEHNPYEEKIKIPLLTKPILNYTEETKNAPSVLSEQKIETATTINPPLKNSEKLSSRQPIDNEEKYISTTTNSILSSLKEANTSEIILNNEKVEVPLLINTSVISTQESNINKIVTNINTNSIENINDVSVQKENMETSTVFEIFEKSSSPQHSFTKDDSILLSNNIHNKSNLEQLDMNNVLNKITENLLIPQDISADNETNLNSTQSSSNNDIITTTAYNIISDLDQLIANISNQFSTENIEIQPYNVTNIIENILNNSANMPDHLNQTATVASIMVDSNYLTTETPIMKTEEITTINQSENNAKENINFSTEIYAWQTTQTNDISHEMTSSTTAQLTQSTLANITDTNKILSEKHQMATENIENELSTTAPLLLTTLKSFSKSTISEPETSKFTNSSTENIHADLSTTYRIILTTPKLVAHSSLETSTHEPVTKTSENSTSITSFKPIPKNVTTTQKPLISDTNKVVLDEKTETLSPVTNIIKTSEMVENDNLNNNNTTTEFTVEPTTPKAVMNASNLTQITSTQAPSTIRVDITTTVETTLIQNKNISLDKLVVTEKIPIMNNTISTKQSDLTTVKPVETTTVPLKTTELNLTEVPEPPISTSTTTSPPILLMESTKYISKNLSTTQKPLKAETTTDKDAIELTTVKNITQKTSKPAQTTITINNTNEEQVEPYRKTDESFQTNNISTTDTWKLVQTIRPPNKNDTNNNIMTTTEKPNIEIYQPTIKIDMSTHGTFGMSDLSEDMYMFSKLYNELALKFWNALTVNEISTDRSVMVSPFGAISVLAMIFLGARGGTSGEMNDLLKLDDIVTFNPHLTFKEVTDSIISRKSLSAVVRELFTDSSKGKVLEFYKGRVKQFYDGHVEEVDFKRINNVIRRRTNSLINKQTRGQMPQYLEETTLHLRAPLSALSTNIFQADCSYASIEGRDGELYFIVLPSMRQRRLVPIPAAVWRSGFIAGYDPELDATAVSLGNTNQVISTIFVIPGQQGHSAPGDVLLRLEARLLNTTYMPETWLQLLRTMLPRPGLEVQLPRFLHKSVINTTAALKRMGLKELFDINKANLQGLNGIAHDLYFSDLVQVNEFSICGETQQMHSEIYPSMIEYLGNHNEHMRNFKYMDYFEEYDYDKYLSIPLPLRPRQARLPEVPRLRFDRPFLYFVRHNPTGLILHMGRFNPRLTT